MKLLGSKGTTGTQASFLELFDGDHEKCREADRRIAAKMGFSQKQFDTENEELVDVEDEEEDEDDSEFFDESSDDVLDEE